MRAGEITCSCGNIYFAMSMHDEIICMACKTMNPNTGDPVPTPIEGDTDATSI